MLTFSALKTIASRIEASSQSKPGLVIYVLRHFFLSVVFNIQICWFILFVLIGILILTQKTNPLKGLSMLLENLLPLKLLELMPMSLSLLFPLGNCLDQMDLRGLPVLVGWERALQRFVSCNLKLCILVFWVDLHGFLLQKPQT